MADDALPERVRKFVAKYLSSVEQMEILLLLSDSPAKSWPMEEVFQRIQSSRASVSEQLARLHQQGFLEASTPESNVPVYHFRPASKELADGVAALKPVYRERRVKVVELIYSLKHSH